MHWHVEAVLNKADGHTVHLDTRPIRTPSKTVLQVPASKRALALAIALEWETLTSVAQASKTHHIPLTSLTARAFDIAALDDVDPVKAKELREGIVEVLMRYLATDTLMCWAPETSVHDPTSSTTESSAALRNLQEETAKPIVSYLTTHVWPGVELIPTLSESSILPLEQPEMTKQVVKGWLMGLTAYDLAGVERANFATKSLLVAVRLVVEWSRSFTQLPDAPKPTEKRFGVEEAAEACSIEVSWQTGRWGEVEDTHDVEKEDLRRQLGSVVLLVQ
jgi:chaperone required for assembly of F1-ATPase